MVEMPDEYLWSSYHSNAWGKFDPIVTPHELFLAIDANKMLREHEYRELFKVNLPIENIHCIREALAANQVLGDGRFREQIEKAVQRKIGYLKRGRPSQVIG